MEFARWHAGSLALTFASWTPRLGVPILTRFLNVRMYLRQSCSSQRGYWEFQMVNSWFFSVWYNI
jgi:hypothetical protein